MIMNEAKLSNIYLNPGEIYIGTKPAKVSTILGSCISVTLYNPRLKVGAICHGILPTHRNTQTGDNNCAKDFKYIDYSIAIMLDKFGLLGVRHKEIDVKVFGGADMISNAHNSTGVLTVGKRRFSPVLRCRLRPIWVWELVVSLSTRISPPQI
jgi:chemotaxis protein CheD